MSPAVSVIIPTYNRREQLLGSVNSVLSQSYADIEVIIVDDGSTDRTREVVESIHDARIVYVRHATNRGGSAARNSGIRAARAPVIALLDDDDRWLPDKLALQLRTLHKSPARVGVVYGGCRVRNLGGRHLAESYPRFRGSVTCEALYQCIFQSPTPLVLKQCFDNVGYFDESFRASQDREMWIRTAKKYHMEFVPRLVAERTIHPQQLSTRLGTKVRSRDMLLQRFRNDLVSRPRTLAKHLRRLGYLSCINGMYKQGRNYLREIIHRSDCFNDSASFHITFSILAPGLHARYLLRVAVPRIDGVPQYY